MVIDQSTIIVSTNKFKSYKKVDKKKEDANAVPPDHKKILDTVVERFDVADKMMKGLKLTYHKAYLGAADEHLWDDKTKSYDYERLNATPVKKKFLDTLMKNLTDYSLKEAGIDKAKNDHVEYLVTQALTGVSEQFLQNRIDTLGEEYDVDAYLEDKRRLVDRVRQSLDEKATADLTMDHRESALKYMDGAHKFLDHGQLTKDEVGQFMRLYHKNGALPEKSVKQHRAYKGKLGKK